MLGLVRTANCPLEIKEEPIVVQKLKKARALIKQGWLQRDLRLRKNGKDYYCVLGAIMTQLRSDSFSLAVDLFHEANQIDHVGTWNDRWYRTKWSVLRAFDKTIALAQKKGEST